MCLLEAAEMMGSSAHTGACTCVFLCAHAHECLCVCKHVCLCVYKCVCEYVRA